MGTRRVRALAALLWAGLLATGAAAAPDDGLQAQQVLVVAAKGMRYNASGFKAVILGYYMLDDWSFAVSNTRYPPPHILLILPEAGPRLKECADMIRGGVEPGQAVRLRGRGTTQFRSADSILPEPYGVIAISSVTAPCDTVEAWRLHPEALKAFRAGRRTGPRDAIVDGAEDLANTLAEARALHRRRKKPADSEP